MKRTVRFLAMVLALATISTGCGKEEKKITEDVKYNIVRIDEKVYTKDDIEEWSCYNEGDTEYYVKFDDDNVVTLSKPRNYKDLASNVLYLTVHTDDLIEEYQRLDVKIKRASNPDEMYMMLENINVVDESLMDRLENSDVELSGIKLTIYVNDEIYGKMTGSADLDTLYLKDTEEKK